MSQLATEIVERVTAQREQLPADQYRQLVDSLATQFTHEVYDVDFAGMPDGPCWSDSERDNALSVYDS
jgi:hypothetical protein